MSADGNLKFTSISHPPVLLKSGQSVHVDCYFRMQKKSPKSRTN